MSLIQVCVLGTVSFALYKAIKLLLRPGIDLDGPKGGNWLTGNVADLFEGGVDHCMHIADKYGGAVKLRAPLAEAICVSDPLALQHILVKDQHIFKEVKPVITSSNVIFGEGLISTIGEQHRRQRKLLNPVFSASNIRQLHTTLQPIADRLATTLAAQLPTDGSQKEIDVLPWLSRCALDSVCQGILGYPSNTLSETDDDTYVEALRMMGPLLGNFMKQRPSAALLLHFCSPNLIRKIVGLLTVPWLPKQFLSDVRELRRVVETMESGSRKAFAEKKTAFDAKDAIDTGMRDMKPSRQTKDIMDIMLRANSASSVTERLTDAELIGQMNVMVFGGLDTTTSALSRCIYLLAKHPNVQARLRSEIRDAMKSLAHGDGETLSAELPYDVLANLPFLDGVVKETFRLFPSFPFSVRQATRDTTLPLQFSTRSLSGTSTSAVAVPKGTHVIIFIIAANRHREMWGPDANEWRPERWLSSSAATASHASLKGSLSFDGKDDKPSPSTPGIKDGMRYPGVYSNMMTFFGGSRSCIGFKFAEMEMKQVLASLILRLQVALPTELDAQGHVKEIEWKLKAIHIPVVKPPAGDGVTPQVPLNLRLVTAEDFVW